MSLIRKHGAVLQAWACLDLVDDVLVGQVFIGTLCST